MEASEPIRVLVVDDHRVVREGLRSYLELVDDIEMVGEAPTADLLSTIWRVRRRRAAYPTWC